MTLIISKSVRIKGLQSNIVVNHIALVDKGRCGSRCSIGDSFMSDKTKKKKISFADRIRNLVKTKDAEEAEKLAKAVEDEDLDIKTDDNDPDDEPDGKTGDTLKQILKQLKTMDSDIQELKAKVEDSDDPDPTRIMIQQRKVKKSLKLKMTSLKLKKQKRSMKV